MDSDYAAALLDPVPEGRELQRSKEIWAEVLEQDDGLVGGEIGRCEDGGVRGGG